MSIALKSINIKNLLSFGPDGIGPEGKGLPLESLNIIIGPNGSGKSNLLEAIGLLQAAPHDLSAMFQSSGGVREWLWMSRDGEEPPVAAIEVVLRYPKGEGRANEWLRYQLSFTAAGDELRIVDEHLESAAPEPGSGDPIFYFGYRNGQPLLAVKDRANGHHNLHSHDLDVHQSVLQQVRGAQDYPELTFVAELFASFRLYTQWTFNALSAPRQAQPKNVARDELLADASNLGAVINRLKDGADKAKMLQYLGEIYNGATNVEGRTKNGSVELAVVENGQRPTPATRLSDGTLRWLALMVVLLDPISPLICIDEPELGLHPDIMAPLGSLLREAAGRTQIIVATHSADLLDRFSDDTQTLVVCTKDDGATQMRRVGAAELDDYMEQESLGQIWQRGLIGGNRY